MVFAASFARLSSFFFFSWLYVSYAGHGNLSLVRASLTIQLLVAPSFFFFSCMQWKLTWEIRNDGETTTKTTLDLFPFFSVWSFFFLSCQFCLCGKTRRRTRSVERCSLRIYIYIRKKKRRKKKTEQKSTDVALSFWIKCEKQTKFRAQFVLHSFPSSLRRMTIEKEEKTGTDHILLFI